jgi:hypothetical protein
MKKPRMPVPPQKPYCQLLTFYDIQKCNNGFMKPFLLEDILCWRKKSEELAKQRRIKNSKKKIERLTQELSKLEGKANGNP